MLRVQGVMNCRVTEWDSVFRVQVLGPLSHLEGSVGCVLRGALVRFYLKCRV